MNQIVRLAGCDLLTIGPELLQQLEDSEVIRWMHNEGAIATEKLAESIGKFNSDAHRLQDYALSQVAEKVG